MKKLLFGFFLLSLLIVGCVNSTSQGKPQSAYQEKGVTTTTTTLPTHLDCTITGQDICERVLGSGTSKCGPEGAICAHIHAKCVSDSKGNYCGSISDPGVKEDPSCNSLGQKCTPSNQRHYECADTGHSGGCLLVDGAGSNKCNPILKGQCAHSACVPTYDKKGYYCDAVIGPGPNDCDLAKNPPDPLCNNYTKGYYGCVMDDKGYYWCQRTTNVLSRIKFTSVLALAFMRKLDQPTVNWICREMNSRNSSVWSIAKRAGVSKQWAYRLYARYQASGVPPERQRCGSKPQPLPDSVKEMILREFAELPNGAVRMQNRLVKKGIRVSHNKIHAVLREHGLAKREIKKSKPRKYVRYERHKANSLWHADWKVLDGKHLVLFEDDATRLITGYGLFDSQSAELSLQVFALAVEKYGLPRQLLTDNGSEFCNTHDKEDSNHFFHGGVGKAGCEHIFTRPSHPQCNGKLEKLNDTIQKLYRHYGGDLSRAVYMYNEKRMHMSLGGGWLTPAEAWQKKIKKGLKYENTIKT